MAFNDPRNAAELLLSPYRPKARILAQLGSLKFGFGVDSPLPGTISKISDITGTLRSTFSSLLNAKSLAQNISVSLSASLTSFSGSLTTAVGSPETGTAIFDSDTGIPSGASFLQFSTLAPGANIPASFQGLLDDRKTQLQALTQRLSTIFSATSFSGVSIVENFNRSPNPRPEQIDLPIIPFLAQGGAVAESDNILQDKRRFTIQGVHIGTGIPSFWSRLLHAVDIQTMPGLNPVVGQVFTDRKNAGSWSEPPTPYAAQYPFNKVQQSESGHIIEIDDTPGAERVHIFHRSGSFIEMHPDGTVVYKNMTDGYDLTMGDKYVKASGNCHISVDGNASLYTKGNVDLQCDGQFNVQVADDFNLYAKNINLRAKRTFMADGIQINLRYINLPTGLIPVPMGGGLAPRINLSALLQDFSGSNLSTVLQAMAANPLDPKTAALQISLNPESVAIPPPNPLSWSGVYQIQSSRAASYRNVFFDNPEETGDFEQYTAHIGLQVSLGDINGNADPRALGGQLLATPLSNTKNTNTIDFLNFDDFKGIFDYPANFQLGNTSFTLAMLVDTLLYPDLIVPDNIPTADAPGSFSFGSDNSVLPNDPTGASAKPSAANAPTTESGFTNPTN